MLDFLRWDKRPKSETFGQLTIERRVLITSKTTISIPNIASISSGALGFRAGWSGPWSLALLAGGVGASPGGPRPPVIAESTAGRRAMCSVAAALARFFSHTEKPCLFISSSDGHTSLVHWPAKDPGGGAPAAVGQDQRRRRERGLPHQLREGRHPDRKAIGASVPAVLAGRAITSSAGAAAAHPTAIPSCRRPARPAPARQRPLPRPANGYHAGLRAGVAQHRRDAALLRRRPDTQDIADRLASWST